MSDLFFNAKIIEPRVYQENAASAVIEYIKDVGGNPIVCSATGTGKSVMIAILIARLARANGGLRAMVATHVQELLIQNSEKLRNIMPGADIGICSAGIGRRETDNQFVFAGIQSIYKNKNLKKFNILIVDEAHTISRKDQSMWQSLIDTLTELNPRLIVIGFSATPFRLDSGSLTSGDGALFDDIVFDYGLGRAIQDGYLCPLTSKFTKTKYDISDVHKLAGEFNLKELEAATNIDALNKSAVMEMIERGSDRKSWLVFCNGVQHSFAVRDCLRAAGITAETVTGETPEDERAKIFDDFRKQKIRALTNNAVLTTGVDFPYVDLIAMMRHTMSGGLLLQMAGRGTRIVIDVNGYKSAKDRRDTIKNSQKPNCLFLDFARNIERHGFLDEIKAKEKGKKGDGVAPMKECPECFTICHAAARKCNDCGYEFPKNENQILTKAHDGNVLANNEPQTKNVIDVIYLPHNLNKEGKTPCLRVKYIHDDDTVTNEYICIEHDGFARQKADKWLNDRSGSVLIGMKTIDIINNKYVMCLKVPSAIVVKKDGKYDRIVNYIGLDFPKEKNQTYINDAKTDDDDFEIPF